MSKETTCELLIEAAIVSCSTIIAAFVHLHKKRKGCTILYSDDLGTTSILETLPCCGKSRPAPDFIKKAGCKDA